MNDLDNDIPKYKKKKKSSTSKAKNKTNHKHEFEEVLYVAPNYAGGTSPHRGTRCKICGKIGDIQLFGTQILENGRYRSLTNKEIYEKYKHLEKVYLDSVWQKFAPLKGGE